MNHKLKKLIILFFVLLIPSFSLFSEDIRIKNLQIINVEQDANFEATAKLNINDALVIFLPETLQYIDGLELKFEIPEELAVQKSACEFAIYEGLNPIPKSGQIDYSGEKIFRGIIPSKFSWIVQIPFSNQNNLKTNQYTTKIGQVPKLKDHYIFVRLHQLIANLPQAVMEADISITIRPILSHKGTFLLNLSCPDENIETCTIFIDDTAYNMGSIKNGIFLESGIHNVTIISEYYRTEVRTIRIDMAKQTELSIRMRSIEPTLIITAPNGIKIYIDDEVCTRIGQEFVIPEGKHKIRFNIGDYEVTRTIAIVKGRTYKANISVDLQVSEE
jgi:hypothetical protein